MNKGLPTPSPPTQVPQIYWSRTRLFSTRLATLMCQGLVIDNCMNGREGREICARGVHALRTSIPTNSVVHFFSHSHLAHTDQSVTAYHSTEKSFSMSPSPFHTKARNDSPAQYDVSVWLDRQYEDVRGLSQPSTANSNGTSGFVETSSCFESC